MTLNYTDIISIAFSSSLIAAGLTVLGNWWLQKDNYQKEYYKKLLSKRIEAYEAIENIISQLKGHMQLDDGRLVPMICSLGRDHFSHFLISLMSAISSSVWLSQQTSLKITELNVFLLSDIDYKIDENKDYENQLEELGAMQRDRIREYRNELENFLYKDLQTLHEIGKFIKETKSNSPGIPLYAKSKELKIKSDFNNQS